MERIALNTNAVAASESADLVVEAIVENLAIKQKLFKDLDAGSPRFVFSSMLGFTTKIVSEFIMGVTRKFSSGARFLVKSFFRFCAQWRRPSSFANFRLKTKLMALHAS